LLGQKGGGSSWAADGSAVFGVVGIGHNGGPPLDRGRWLAAFLLEKSLMPALENTAREIAARSPRPRRGAQYELSRIHRNYP
jgi:hypothetical protein